MAIAKNIRARANPSRLSRAGGSTQAHNIAWLEPVGGGLISAIVSGNEYLVDDSLQGSLAGLIGRPVTICHVDRKWGAGALLHEEVPA
jgi:hypothetical protein